MKCVERALSVDQRIFVVGVPRSGTTLVQSLLASHDRVTSFSESHFLSRHYASWPYQRTVLIRDPRARMREFLAENAPTQAIEDDAGAAVWSRGYHPRLLLPFRSREFAHEWLTQLDRLAIERRRAVWVEKTPRHLLFLPFLESFATDDGPRLDFVHVIRGGMATMASLLSASRRWPRAYSLRQCADRWNHDMELSLGRVGSGRDTFVFYEELTTNPQNALQELTQALGLSWQSEILERYSEASRSLVTAEETWKRRLDGPIQQVSSSEESLTEAEREKLDRWLRLELYDQLYQECQSSLERWQ